MNTAKHLAPCHAAAIGRAVRYALLAGVVGQLLAARLAAGQEPIVVAPAGVTTWAATLQRDAGLAGARAAREPRIAPRMPRPPLPVIDFTWPAAPATAAPAGMRAGAPSLATGFAPSPQPPVLSGGFQALSDPGWVIPPDTMGAVGPAHVMTMLNSEVRIQTKAGTDLGTVSLYSFWTSGTGLGGNPFDPRLHYDSIDGRWIATVDANQSSSSSQVWFAISQSSDPTGAWSFYGFVADPTGQSWADYPGFGFNATWIAITNNMFPVSNPFSMFDGAKMWVIDKASALAGGPLTVTVFPKFFDVAAGVFSFTLHPAVTFGTEPKLYIVDLPALASSGGALVRLSEITGTGPAPTWAPTAGSLMPGSGMFTPVNDFDFSTIAGEQLGVPSTCDGGPYSGLPCGSSVNCNYPSGTCRGVDTGDAMVGTAPAVRNGRIWLTHSGGLPVDAVDRTAVFWYELDPALMASTGAPIVQSGIVQGAAGSHYFYPSIAVNADDDTCIGFSRSDPGRYIEAAAVARAGEFPPNTMGPVMVLKAGEDTYYKTFGSDRNRWGDYSATVVDPADDQTFWAIQEYAASPAVGWGGGRWATWWGKLEVVVTCGDGVREGAEECDDGNALDGDCCTSACLLVAAGTACPADGNPCTDDVCDTEGACGVPNTGPCDDGSVCTEDDACDGAGSCTGTAIGCDDGNPCTQNLCVPATGCAYPHQPRVGCRVPSRSIIVVKNNADDTKDKLVWKWLKGTTPIAELGNPTTATNYALCLYPADASVTPPIGLPAGTAAWTAIGTTGYQYASATALPDGVTKGTFKSGTSRAKIILKGKGVNLPDPTLPLATPLTVQLVNDAPGACWEAAYAPGDVLKATGAVFKAKK